MLDVPQKGFAPWVRASLSVPAGCAADQHSIIRARISALAPVLAALTLAWSVLDVLALPRETWAPIVTERVVIASALLMLARASERVGPYLLVHLFVWIQAMGFGLMQALFVDDPGLGLAVGYGLAPFVIAAQLALFPVTWLQVLRAGLAPAFALLLVHFAHARVLDAGFWNDVWLLALLLGTAAWTSQAQLRLLAHLAHARDDASRDALTGLANRRSAQLRLQAEHERFVRHAAPLTVLMLDLDRFKSINDRWGHAAGDQVLRATATAIAAELRGCDLGARHGGEEFLVMLADTEIDDGLRVAERIRRRIAALEIEADEAILQVTISIGAAQLRAGETIDGLVARADAALYRAKDQGRDRCVADD